MTKQWISQRVDLLGVMNQMEDQLQLIPRTDARYGLCG
jgi:hypothetical protein